MSAQPTPPAGDWTEGDWERHLRRADARGAKFDELYETLRTHPNREAIICVEMGWSEALKSCGGPSGRCPACGQRLGCEPYALLHLRAHPEESRTDPAAAALLAHFSEVLDLPAWRAACTFAEAVERALALHADDSAVVQAVDSAQQAAAHIAAGHAFGYSHDGLRGNLACCRRAVNDLLRTIELVRHLAERRLLGDDEARALLDEAVKASAEVARWMARLRSRSGWR